MCCGGLQKCPLDPAAGCCGWACQFVIECDDDVDGSFDFESNMLYPRAAFAIDGTFTLPNSPPGQQPLSPGDIARVRELYGCPAPKCPVGCNPTSGANTCSVPTAQDCIYPSLSTPNPRAACACRAGYKATVPGIADTDTTKQWRLPADEGSFRVWVAQGVACDTLCDVSTGVNSCQEVVELPADCLHN